MTAVRMCLRVTIAPSKWLLGIVLWLAREAPADERIRFNPTILPPYARRTKSLEVLIPIASSSGAGGFFKGLAAEPA